MNKIKLIVQREYLTRIRKRSFIVMTILGPILMAAMFIVPIWLAMRDVDMQYIEVVDETYAFYKEFENSKTRIFDYSEDGIMQAKADFFNTNYTAILYIPRNTYSSPNAIRLFHKKQPSIQTITYLNNKISSIIERDRIRIKFDIKSSELKALRPDISVMTVSLDESGKEEESVLGLNMILGLIGAVLIYFFIFLYGVQVMRGVIEEKTNRIIEVIISSVKPFQLMMGKIIGIALVGLTQFLLWVILTLTLVTTAQSVMPETWQKAMKERQHMEEFMPGEEAGQVSAGNEDNLVSEISKNISQINFPVILLVFVFYFLGGYLLYGALLAAVGSAVDSEADTQQFMLPVTIPLILAIMLSQFVIANPDGSWAFWLSIFPHPSS